MKASGRTGGAGSRVRWWSALAGFVAGAVAGAAVTALLGALLSGSPRSGGYEPGTLKILSAVDDGFGNQRQALIDQWNGLGGGRPRAELVPVAGRADAVRDDMVHKAQNGGGDIDIYNLDVTEMAEFVHFNYLRPLDRDRVDLDGFLENPLHTCERDGKLWALPFNTDAALLYYRSDLLGDAPVPTSWAGIRNRIDDVFASRSGGAARTALQAGYAGQFADYEGGSVNAFEAIWGAGGDVVDDKGNVVIDSPEAQEGLDRLVSGFQAGNPQVILGDSLRFREDEATQAFRDGQTVFMRNWPVEYWDLVGGESKQAPVQFKVARIPGPSVLGGQNLAIGAHSDQPRAAQELINFLTSARSQQILFEHGGFAATREVVYHDLDGRQHPYAATLLDAVKHAKARPDTPYYALFSKVFREGIRALLAPNGRLPDGFSARLADALRGVSR